MRKRFFGFLVVIFALSCVFLSALSCSGDNNGETIDAPKSRQELFDEAKHKTVLINAAINTGSGTIVKKTVDSVDIITNYHVIKNAFEAGEPIKIKYFGTEVFFDAEVLGFIESYDLCVLRAAYEGDVEAFDFTAPNEFVGESVVAVGYNGGQIGAYDGIISTISKRVYVGALKENMFLTQTTAPFAEGCSGGAIIDSNGNFLGISSYTLLTNFEGQSLHTGISYCIPRLIVSSFYERIVGGESYPFEPLTGFIINSDYSVTINIGSYHFTASETDSRLMVTSSSGGTVLAGDIIAKINGVKLDAADKMIVFLGELLKAYDEVYFTLA